MFRSLSIFLVAVSLIFVPAANAAPKWLTKLNPVKSTKEKEKSAKVTKQSKVAKQTKVAQKPSPAKTKAIVRIERDVHRLESLLAGAKTSVKLSDKSWKSMANEADTLANRIHANVKSANAEKNALRTAEDLRDQVKRMKQQAHEGDYKQTRRHAQRALALAYRLDEWAG
jgi:hypothetical protein